MKRLNHERSRRNANVRVVILNFKFWILNEEKNEEANSSKGERGHLARCVTHLAGQLLTR